MTASPVRLRVVALAAAAVAALSGCAAGQIAQTADEKPSIDGVNRNAGPIAIRGLVLESPDGNSYAKGSIAELRVVLVNTGTSTDTLVGISGSSFTSWQSAQDGASEGSQSVSLSPGSAVSYGTPNATGSLRLTGLTSTLYPGSSITMTLKFTKAGSVTTQVPVELSATAPSAVISAPSGSSGE